VLAALASPSLSVNRYPEQAAAVEAIAAWAGTTPEHVVLTNGSDELCYLVANLLLGPGRVAVLGEPCYQIDATASLLSGAELRRVPLGEDGSHDLRAMARASSGASVVWLPSPHNPTGAACRPEDIEELLGAVPDDCLVVLDEAYRAFADRDMQPDIGALLGRHPNLLVQRTLSKDWALAGLRVGYGIAAPELVEVIARSRPPFSVNAVALAALQAAAGNEAWRSMSIGRVRHERRLLQSALASGGVDHYPSQANFVTARLDAAVFGPALAATGTVVRAGEDLGLPGWVRISIGWAPQMAVLRDVLAARTRRGGTEPDNTEPGNKAVTTTKGA
jgi:histidinol-phosphate aminotransferase